MTFWIVILIAYVPFGVFWALAWEVERSSAYSEHRQGAAWMLLLSLVWPVALIALLAVAFVVYVRGVVRDAMGRDGSA